MKVELSERARKRVEELVEDGSFRSAEAVIEEAVEQFASREPALTRERVRELLEEGYADLEAGRVHPAEAVLADARALLAKRVAKPANL